MYKLWLLIRSLTFYLSLALTSIMWVGFLYLLMPFNVRYRLRLASAWCGVSGFLARVICGISYEVKGRDNLHRSVLYFCRHESAWETIILPWVLPEVCIVCKRELLMIPIFGWGLALLKPIAIQREQSLRAFKQVVAQGKDRLHQGLSVLVFPEGTRVAPDEFPPYHKSGGALAKGTGFPVVPIVHNAGHVWRRNSLIKYPGKITVVIGEPIDTKGLTLVQLNEAVYRWCQETRQYLN